MAKLTAPAYYRTCTEQTIEFTKKGAQTPVLSNKPLKSGYSCVRQRTMPPTGKAPKFVHFQRFLHRNPIIGMCSSPTSTSIFPQNSSPSNPWRPATTPACCTCSAPPENIPTACSATSLSSYAAATCSSSTIQRSFPPGSTDGAQVSAPGQLSPRNAASRDFLRGRIEVLLTRPPFHRTERLAMPG